MYLFWLHADEDDITHHTPVIGTIILQVSTLSIHDNCQFWYTAALFRLIKSTPKGVWIRDKVAKIKKYTGLKKSTPPLAGTFVTSISYDFKFEKGTHVMVSLGKMFTC